jgi:hydroxypyruvate isomerase
MMSGITNGADAALPAYCDAARMACERFADITVLMEPINPRNMPGYFLNDFAVAESVIAALGLPNLKLQFDIYHRQIMHGDVTIALRRLMPIIGHIQIASVPSRHEPDDEELTYPFLFAELDRLGYDGFVGAEYHPRAGTLEGLSWFKKATT